MGIFSFLSRGSKSQYHLALDIGTEVVKALIFAVDEEHGQAVVLGVGRVAQRTGNMQSGAVADISGVIESSREAIKIAQERSNVRKITKSIIGIAGELVKGTTTTVHYERVNPEIRIGTSELKTIIGKVQEKAFERIKRQLIWETGQEGIEIKLINASLVDVRIDGYRKNNPLNFQGHDVSMSVFNAYAPLTNLGALESIAQELKLHENLSIAAEPYAVARSVEVEDMSDFGAIFIDIGGGTTDIAIVRNGGLEGTKMFALGGRAFTKRLCQEFELTLEKAEEMKIAYSFRRLSPENTEKIARLYAEDARVWLGGVEISLSEFAETDVLPSRIFLCGGGSALPEIKQVLSSVEWTDHLPFSRPPQVSFLQPKDISRVTDQTGELNNPQDITPLGLVNLVLLNTAEHEKMLSVILERTMQSIDRN